jgi:tripartite ATP-independent transporter DctP family solute receptor
MRFKKTALGLAAGALAGGILTFAAGVNAADFTIRYAGTAPASNDNPEYMAMVKFKDVAESQSKGRLKVELYPANQLGATKEFTEGVSLGTVEMGESGYDIIGLLDPQAYALTMPYLHKTLEHYIKVLDGPIGEEIAQHIIKKTNMRILGVLMRGPRHVMNSKRPVRTPADMKGLRIRSPENPLNAGTVKAMGATPIPMTWSEVYTALSQGVADGVENSIDELYAARLYEVQKYLSLTGHIYVGVPIIINEDFYKKLPDDLKAVVKTAARESVLERREALKTSETANLEKMKKAGITVITDVALDQFAPTAKAVWEKFVDGDNITWDLLERIRTF